MQPFKTASDTQGILKQYAGEQSDAHSGKHPFCVKDIVRLIHYAAAEGQIRAYSDQRVQHERVRLGKEAIGQADGYNKHQGKRAKADGVYRS